MAISYNGVLASFGERRKLPPTASFVVKGLEEHHKIDQKYGMPATLKLLTEVAEGRKVKDGTELGDLILAEAQRLKAEGEAAALKVLGDIHNNLAERANRQAIEDSYLVADEAAQVIARVKSSEEMWRKATEWSEDRRMKIELEYQQFREGPPWLRAWRAFRGKV